MKLLRLFSLVSLLVDEADPRYSPPPRLARWLVRTTGLPEPWGTIASFVLPLGSLVLALAGLLVDLRWLVIIGLGLTLLWLAFLVAGVVSIIRWFSGNADVWGADLEAEFERESQRWRDEPESERLRRKINSLERWLEEGVDENVERMVLARISYLQRKVDEAERQDEPSSSVALDRPL